MKTDISYPGYRITLWWCLMCLCYKKWFNNDRNNSKQTCTDNNNFILILYFTKTGHKLWDSQMIVLGFCCLCCCCCFCCLYVPSVWFFLLLWLLGFIVLTEVLISYFQASLTRLLGTNKAPPEDSRVPGVREGSTPCKWAVMNDVVQPWIVLHTRVEPLHRQAVCGARRCGSARLLVCN